MREASAGEVAMTVFLLPYVFSAILLTIGSR